MEEMDEATGEVIPNTVTHAALIQRPPKEMARWDWSTSLRGGDGGGHARGRERECPAGRRPSRRFEQPRSGSSSNGQHSDTPDEIVFELPKLQRASSQDSRSSVPSHSSSYYSVRNEQMPPLALPAPPLMTSALPQANRRTARAAASNRPAPSNRPVRQRRATVTSAMPPAPAPPPPAPFAPEAPEALEPDRSYEDYERRAARKGSTRSSDDSGYGSALPRALREGMRGGEGAWLYDTAEADLLSRQRQQHPGSGPLSLGDRDFRAYSSRPAVASRRSSAYADLDSGLGGLSLADDYPESPGARPLQSEYPATRRLKDRFEMTPGSGTSYRIQTQMSPLGPRPPVYPPSPAQSYPSSPAQSYPPSSAQPYPPMQQRGPIQHQPFPYHPHHPHPFHSRPHGSHPHQHHPYPPLPYANGALPLTDAYRNPIWQTPQGPPMQQAGARMPLQGPRLRPGPGWMDGRRPQFQHARTEPRAPPRLEDQMPSPMDPDMVAGFGESRSGNVGSESDSTWLMSEYPGGVSPLGAGNPFFRPDEPVGPNGNARRLVRDD